MRSRWLLNRVKSEAEQPAASNFPSEERTPSRRDHEDRIASKRTNDPIFVQSRREPRSEWCAEEHSNSERDGPSHPSMKCAGRNMDEAPCQCHDREGELRCCRRNVNWKAKKLREHRDMHDPTTDPKRAGDIADQQTDGDSYYRVNRVI